MHRQEIANASDPEARRAELTQEYKEQFANPIRAAELGFVDEVIRPRELRRRLCEHLRRLRNKKDEGPKRKHGNIPL
jgi:acetyl-CoA carboxylase carboxyltransferase component